MKLTLAILAAVLLLAGCGHSAPNHDPFVGTWQAVGFDPGNGYAISKVSGATYRVAEIDHFKQHGSALYSRRGSNELISRPGQLAEQDVIKFNPASGRLTETPRGDVGAVLTKVSNSTAPPSPWPTKSP